MATDNTNTTLTDTIRLNYYPQPTMDFFALRNSAIAQIQQLASGQWTDYNEHDPGVTIVEQLCYAITDLSYRTSFKVEDLLAEQPEYTGPGKDTFYTIDQIMPCHPETLNDWRKLFLDKIKPIENIWIEPIPTGPTSPGMLYNILIQLKNYIGTDLTIVDKVKNIFYAYRNLGEDIGTINVLKEYPVHITASIGIDGKESIEELLANIYCSIYLALTPQIPRYTISDLQKQGYTEEEIFETPSFENGFIRNEDLYPRAHTVDLSDLIIAVRNVKGVDTVFSFEVENADKDIKILRIKEGEVAVLDPDLKKQHITLTINQKAVTVDMNVVQILYKQKLTNSTDWVKMLQNKNDIQRYNVPHGTNRDVAFYRSVQYTFPGIYGIGNNIRTSRDGYQRSQLELQLKGYLLLFDQMLANYLGQLSSVAALFSIVPGIDQTYFTQIPDDLPNLQNLVGGMDTDGSWKKEYEKYLKKIMGEIDDFYQRRNLFLDHLLSRFGVDVAQIAPEILNWYRIPANEYEQFVVGMKCYALRNIIFLTRNRGAACNVHAPKSISCFEQIVMLQLGITGYKKHPREVFWSMAKPIFQSHIDLGFDPDKRIQSEFTQTENGISTSDSKEFRRLTAGITEDGMNFNYRRLVKMLEDGTLYISIDMLVGGFISDNYWIGNFDNGYPILYFDDSKDITNPQNKGILVGTFKTEEEAEGLIPQIVKFVRELNLRTEGLHLVEHLLLRDSDPEKRYYVEFLEKHKKTPLLISIDTATLEGRDELARKIIHAGRFHFSVLVNHNIETGKWNFKLLDTNRIPVARSYYEYNDRKTLNRALDELEVYFNFTEPEEEFIKKYCRYKEFDHPVDIPTWFFSFRMSVILPNWPSRYKDEFYCSRIRNMLRSVAPSQLGIYTIYLGPDEMLIFETLYQGWRDALALHGEQNEQTKKQAHHVAVFLYAKHGTLI